jgi:prepilin-type processing-associated H-X9-DG protein
MDKMQESMKATPHHVIRRAAAAACPGSPAAGCEPRGFRRPSRQRAFTRLELVVAVVVAGLLAWCLMLPAFQSPKAYVRRAACANNLCQLGNSLNLFATEFDHYPIGPEWMVLAVPRSVSRLRACLPKDPTTLVCPERIVELDGAWEKPTPFNLFSYGYNEMGSAYSGQDLELGMGRFQYIAISQITVPCEMITLGDTGLGTTSEGRLNPHETVGGRGNDPWPYQLPSARHRGGANILFCDGHVTYGKQKKWIEENDQARRQWNNDHQPHPETR